MKRYFALAIFLLWPVLCPAKEVLYPDGRVCVVVKEGDILGDKVAGDKIGCTDPLLVVVSEKARNATCPEGYEFVMPAGLNTWMCARDVLKPSWKTD
jgi:hypothetical protein